MRKFLRRQARRFVVAVLALAVALTTALLLYGGSLLSRSSNALDELYYATMDARSGDVASRFIMLDSKPIDVLLAAASPFKSLPPDLMAEVEPWDGPYYPKGATNTFTNPWMSDTYGDMVQYICEYRYGEEAAEEAGLTSLVWRASDVGKYNRLEIEARFPAKRFAVASADVPDGEAIEATLEYNVASKALRCRFVELAEKSGQYDVYSDENMAKLGIDEKAVASEAVRIVKEELLPAFLTRGGTTPRFSADFEQDGVTVDLTRDAADL